VWARADVALDDDVYATAFPGAAALRQCQRLAATDARPAPTAWTTAAFVYETLSFSNERVGK
jgi:hypothetical protein